MILWCSPQIRFNSSKLIYNQTNFPQQEPNFKFQKCHDDLIDKGRYLSIQICKICYCCDGSMQDNVSTTLGH